MKRATKRERKRRWRRKAKAWAMAKRELLRLGAALERLDGAVDRCAGELAPPDVRRQLLDQIAHYQGVGVIAGHPRVFVSKSFFMPRLTEKVGNG